MTGDVLIVDDERDICELVSGILTDSGYATRTASDSDTALNEIAKRCPSLVLLDIWLQGSRLDGLEVLKLLKERLPNLPVVIISGHGNLETAVSAIKIGAYDYIEKPFKSDRLLLVIQRAIENSKLKRENSELRRKTGQYELIGDSIVVQKLRSSINKIGPTNSRVLITGPSGSGKELVARALHKNSERASASFVAINAAILEPENMEYVLFGRIEDGNVMPGLLEQAHGGSLYIDEVGEMPLDTQGKILRVLTEQKFVRIGGGPNVSVDIRVMSSSSRDLTNHIAKGLFREDLYHRLNVVPIEVPSLAQRREDIGMLVDNFVDYLVNSSCFPPRKIAPDALAVMQSHAWPGNVRQLRNCVENMLISAADSEHDTITADMLPADILSATKLNIEESDSTHIMTLQLREAREIFEKQYLLAQIDRFGGNISKTAEFVGMERSALHRKLKTLGVNPTKHLKPA